MDDVVSDTTGVKGMLHAYTFDVPDIPEEIRILNNKHSKQKKQDHQQQQQQEEQERDPEEEQLVVVGDPKRCRMALINDCRTWEGPEKSDVCAGPCPRRAKGKCNCDRWGDVYTWGRGIFSWGWEAYAWWHTLGGICLVAYTCLYRVLAAR